MEKAFYMEEAAGSNSENSGADLLTVHTFLYNTIYFYT